VPHGKGGFGGEGRVSAVKARDWVLLLFVGVLLTSCSGGPSKRDAERIVYGIYIRETTIVGKTRCEPTDRMTEDGHTNVWLIRYRFKDRTDVHGMLIEEVDGEWQIYAPNVEECP
jgi:hypothetical protein